MAGHCTCAGKAGCTFFLEVVDNGCKDTLHIIVKGPDNNKLYEAQGKVSVGGILVLH